MTKSNLFLVSIALAVTPLQAAKPALSARTLDPAMLTLTIRLYNHAGAPGQMLAAAAEVGGEIFSRAGIETTWVTCRTRPDQPSHPSCSNSPGKSVIRVNVLNRAMSEKIGTVPEAFGVAFTGKKGFGLVASVFQHRVAELERDTGVDGELIFGHILAHEIGHLLLGFKSHVQRGIMSGHWDEVQMLHAGQGAFGFFESQARRMRKQVQARAAEDQATL